MTAAATANGGPAASVVRKLPRVTLVHGPTPIVRAPALDERFGVRLWIKRDDATAGAESGNKVRKLELLLGEARAKRADVVVTCGGLQSNHARATAIACAQLGMRCILLLRVGDESGLPTDPYRAAPRDRLPTGGNVLLDRLVGAEIRFVSKDEYAQRAPLMDSVALDLARQRKTPYVIPEGGSNGLGALGYVEAMREVRAQIDAGLGGGPAPFDVVVHACGSGGTAAGIALGAAHHGVARAVRAMAVCDDAAYFERTIARIVSEARGWAPALGDPKERGVDCVVDDRARGPAYAVMDAAQRAELVAIARASGVLLDPVYTGKAMIGLGRAVERGDIARGARVLFVHTGGLPGLLAQGDALAEST